MTIKTFLMGLLVGCALTLSVPAAAKTVTLPGLSWVGKELAHIKRDVASAARAQWVQVYWMKRQAIALEQRTD